MQQKSFEEELNRKTARFSLTPREGLWESIEEQLVPEKRKRRAVWLWLPVGLLAIGAIVYLSVPNAQVTKKATSGIIVEGEMKASASAHHDIPDKTVLPPVNTGKEEVKNRMIYERPIAHSRIQLVNNGIKLLGNDFTKETAVPIRSESLNSPKEEILKPEIEVLKAKNNTNDFEGSLVSVLPSADSLIESNEAIKPYDTSINIKIAPAPVKDRIYIGIIFTPFYSGSMLTLGSRSIQATTDYNSRKGTDKHSPGYGISLLGGYKKGRHDFYTGIQYRVMAYQLLVRNVEKKTPIIGSNPTTTGFRYYLTDSFASSEKGNGGNYYTNRFNYLSIPVGYAFRVIGKHKLSMGITGNAAYNILLNSNALVYNEESGYYLKQSATNESNLRKSNFMLAAGLDINYRLNTKYVFTLCPQYGFSLTPVEKAAIETGLRYWGIGAGVKLFLK